MVKQKTCHIRLEGGLGNQLFIVAAGLAYCYKYDLQMELFPTPNKRSYYWTSLLRNFSNFVVQADKNLPEYVEPTFGYRQIPEGKQKLIGYFQSSKYFTIIKSIVKNFVTFSDPERIQQKLTSKYGILTEKHVIVHARRGDYIQFAEYHNPLSDTYYEDALKEIKKRIQDPIFIMLSDDKDYWKASPVFQKETYIIIDEDEITTLFLMTKCKHFIMANSTFSWWGAYLANSKTVIAPKQWFGPKGPQDWQDIYEDDWIRV